MDRHSGEVEDEGEAYLDGDAARRIKVRKIGFHVVLDVFNELYVGVVGNDNLCKGRDQKPKSVPINDFFSSSVMNLHLYDSHLTCSVCRRHQAWQRGPRSQLQHRSISAQFLMLVEVFGEDLGGVPKIMRPEWVRAHEAEIQGLGSAFLCWRA